MHSQWNLKLDLHKTEKKNQVSDYICIRRQNMAQIVHEKNISVSPYKFKKH